LVVQPALLVVATFHACIEKLLQICFFGAAMSCQLEDSALGLCGMVLEIDYQARDDQLNENRWDLNQRDISLENESSGYEDCGVDNDDDGEGNIRVIAKPHDSFCNEKMLQSWQSTVFDSTPIFNQERFFDSTFPSHVPSLLLEWAENMEEVSLLVQNISNDLYLELVDPGLVGKERQRVLSNLNEACALLSFCRTLQARMVHVQSRVVGSYMNEEECIETSTPLSESEEWRWDFGSESDPLGEI